MSKQHDKITPNDISYILENPWEITDYEWRLGDKDNRNDMLSYIKEKLKLTLEDGYSKLWKTQDDKPIAILGAFKVEDKKLETLFVASKHMEEHSLKISFNMRQILKDQSYNYKGHTLGLYSESEHPKQITWFRFLGFKYLPEGNRDNTRYFEYVSRVK